MAFLKYARSTVLKSDVNFDSWNDSHKGNAFQNREARRIVVDRVSSKDYLLSHCTIVASADAEESGLPLGRHLVDGFEVNRQFSDFYVKQDSELFFNNNHDGWSRPLILGTYKTFIGSPSYIEHCQIPEYAKGKILDAVARDVGPSVYVDILVGTERKHKPLIAAILSRKINALSMGCSIQFSCCTQCGNVAADETELCFPPGTRVLRSDGLYTPIEELVSGDVVLTHKGNARTITETTSRDYSGELVQLRVDGVPTPLRSTHSHPYLVFRPKTVCACGCGQPLARTVEHRRGAAKAFERMYLPGHNTHEGIAQHKLVSITPEFVAARDIAEGDYLAFPVTGEFCNTPDGTEEKAKLIGYFASEGSFIKRRGKRVGVSFAFGAHESETLVADVVKLLECVFGGVRKAPVVLWEDAVQRDGTLPVKRRSTSRVVPEDLTCPSCAAPSVYLRNASFKKGSQCYQCKVCHRSFVLGAERYKRARVYQSGNSCDVRFLCDKAADFFYRHCGEYASTKRLSPEVMSWPQELQRHVLWTWLCGDGSQTSGEGVKGTSVSFNLISQMHLIAARCGLYARRAVVFGGRSVAVGDVVGSDGIARLRDARGWLPTFVLVLPAPQDLKGILRFTDKARKTLARVTSGYKRVGDYLLYRVRKKSCVPYSGKVYNVEVADDHSYVVDGVAVHNCNHIKFFKGNYFIDPYGKRRRVGEFCGHASDLESNKFVEASWVGNPAFDGAVLRNILNASDFDKTAYGNPDTVFSFPSVSFVPPAGVKLANQQDDPFATPSQGDAGAGDSKAKTEKPPLEDAVKDLHDTLKEKVVENVRKELDDATGDAALKVTQSPQNENENLIKSAASSPLWRKRVAFLSPYLKSYTPSFNRRLLAGLIRVQAFGWGNLKTAGYAPEEVLVLSYLVDRMKGKPAFAGERRLYAALSKADLNAPCHSVSLSLGRPLTATEQSLVLEKCNLLQKIHANSLIQSTLEEAL